MKYFCLTLFFILINFNAVYSIYSNEFGKSNKEIKLDQISECSIRKLIKENQLDSALKAIHYLERGKKSTDQKLRLLNLKAEVFEKANLFGNAAQVYTAMYDDIDNKADSMGWACLTNIIVNNDRSGNHEVNTVFLNKANSILKQKKSPERLAELLNIKSIIYRQSGFYQKALEYIDSAIQINKDLNDLEGLCINYTTKGNLYHHSWDLQKASEYYDLAYETNLKNKSNTQKIRNQLNIASNYQAARNYKEALKIYKGINTQNQSPQVKLTKQFSLGLIYFDLLDSKLSIAHFDSSIVLANQIKDYKKLKYIYERKAQLFASEKKFQEAYNTEILANQYKDSLNEQSLIQSIENIELSKSFVAYNHKLKEATYKRQIFNYRAILIVVALSIVCSILIGIIYIQLKLKNKLFSLYGRNIKKLKQERNEHSKLNSEIENSLDVNKALKSDMNKMSFTWNESMTIFDKLIGLLKEYSNLPSKIKEMEPEIERLVLLMKSTSVNCEQLEENNIELRNKIIQTYPQLNRNEVKLCILIRMDLSVKEIASYNNITTGSAEMARYRLRKKLGFNSMTELIQRLNQI